MQKKEKKVLKRKSRISPHKLKRAQSPSEKKKSSTYKLKRNLNYTEKPELHLTNTYIQKEEEKKQNIKSSPLS